MILPAGLFFVTDLDIKHLVAGPHGMDFFFSFKNQGFSV